MDKDERVVELTDLPQSDIGAPLPEVFATDYGVSLAYELSGPEDHGGCAVCHVLFETVDSVLFGSPNDEVISGHRLHSLGVHAYSFYRIENSKWIADLCARNRVHRRHRDDLYSGYKHFVFTFHDSTFEIVAESYRWSVHREHPFKALDLRP